MFSALRCCLVAGASVLLTYPALAGPHAPGKPGQKPAAAATRPAATPRPAAPLLALAAPAPTGPEAARPGVLTGVVLRPDGQPCPGAAVYLAGAARQLVVTDAQGAFRLPGVPAGKPVTVLADYFGLGSTRLVVAAPAGQPKEGVSQPLRLTLGQ